MARQRVAITGAPEEAATPAAPAVKRKRNPAQEMEETSNSKADEIPKASLEKLLDTGSTLLNLSISGGVVREGGLPTSIMSEFYGPHGCGKTALVSSCVGSAQRKFKAKVRYLDPEGRFSKEYARLYGVKIKAEDYKRPDTVAEMFSYMQDWDTEDMDRVHIIAADSLAALSTELELSKEGDKRGQKRAKDFSEGFRKTARKIAHPNRALISSNQIRTGDDGRDIAPGGTAIGFYMSVIVTVKPTWQANRIERERTIVKDVKQKRVVGIRSTCQVVKNSVDRNYRKCNVSFVYDYGIDDIRDQLEWYKEVTGAKTFDALDSKHHAIDDAIDAIEGDHEGPLELNPRYQALRNRTIDHWNEVEALFKRQRKARF